MMSFIVSSYQKIISFLEALKFIPLLSLRLYLAPIFIGAGWHKFVHFDDVVAWFGNTEWGLGLPAPDLMLSLTIIAELIGGFALLFGLATRLFAFLLTITMIVAIVTVHWQHGWFAITPTTAETSTAWILNKIGFWGSADSLANTAEAAMRLARARDILQEHGNYQWLTETGNFVILNNGIEFAATYLIMLITLLCCGAGRYLSVDFWLKRLYSRTKA